MAANMISKTRQREGPRGRTHLVARGREMIRNLLIHLMDILFLILVVIGLIGGRFEGRHCCRLLGVKSLFAKALYVLFPRRSLSRCVTG